MGHKKVCLDCRRAQNISMNFEQIQKSYSCSACGKEMIILPHRFRPPAKTDLKGWELVQFLVENGFPYQHIYINSNEELSKSRVENYASWPENIREAREFVQKYADQAVIGFRT